MQNSGAAIIFSAGDLVGHLNCRYLTHLDIKVARGELAILDRWIKGQAVWAKWPGNGEEYQGTVEKISGTRLRIVWRDGDAPTWVDIKDVRPKHAARRSDAT